MDRPGGLHRLELDRMLDQVRDGARPHLPVLVIVRSNQELVPPLDVRQLIRGASLGKQLGQLSSRADPSLPRLGTDLRLELLQCLLHPDSPSLILELPGIMKL